MGQQILITAKAGNQMDVKILISKNVSRSKARWYLG
jgi:hypothetical protein